MVEGVSTAINMNDFKFLGLITNRDPATAVGFDVWNASVLTVKFLITQAVVGIVLSVS